MRYTHSGIMPSAATVLDKAVNRISLAEFKDFYYACVFRCTKSREGARKETDPFFTILTASVPDKGHGDGQVDVATEEDTPEVGRAAACKLPYFLF